MKQDSDYSVLLRNYDAKIIESVGKSIDKIFNSYIEQAKNLNPINRTRSDVLSRLGKIRDSIIYEAVQRKVPEDRIESFVREQAPLIVVDGITLPHGFDLPPVHSRVLDFVVDKYSRKDDVTYEVACGYMTHMASSIYKKIGDRNKIFFVDPHAFPESGGEFSKYGSLVQSYVESFRLEDGALVTDVIQKKKGRVKIRELPRADAIYIHDAMPFIDSPGSFWNARIYERGYSSMRDSVSGLRSILKDGGKLVVIGHDESTNDAEPELEKKFKTRERSDLSAYIFEDPKKSMIRSVKVFA